MDLLTDDDIASRIRMVGPWEHDSEEKMLIRAITGNRLKVKRSVLGSVIKPHDINVPINLINVQDDAMVTPQVIEGDDFGFGETKTEYSDGSIYSVAQGMDSDL